MDNQGKILHIPDELWEQFKEAADIGRRKDDQTDYEGLARIYIEQALYQYIALKRQVRGKP